MGLQRKKGRKKKDKRPFRCGHLAIDRVTKKCITCGTKVATLKAWLKPPKPPKVKTREALRLGVKQCRNEVVENGRKLRCLEIWRLVRFKGRKRIATVCMGCRQRQHGVYAKLANKW